MSEPIEAEGRTARPLRTALIVVCTILLAFIFGAGWQFMHARQLERDLVSVRQELEFTRLEAALGAAALEANRGSYEVARQLASDFYTGLQARIENTPDVARQHFTAVLDQRDAVITGLSRSDSTTATALADLYLQWKSGMAALEAQPAAR